MTALLAHARISAGAAFQRPQLSLSLGGASQSATARYLDLLVDTMLMRRQPENIMRTTVTLDTALVERALELLGPMDRSNLLEHALKSLIARE
ncbi:MAG: type II toxin-antitoxin system VapB family antitoxin [Burkholderiaceae bacterium]